MKITQNAFLRKIRNINGGDWLKELKNVLTDITSDFKNENGESLLTENKKINTAFLPNSPSLEGTNYVFVQGNGTPLENGTELLAAYNAAKTMSPSSSNRITVIVAPGEYKLVDTFVMDTEFVDLVSLTGNADVVLDKSLPSSYNNDPFQFTLSPYDIVDISPCIIVLNNNIFIKGVSSKRYDSANWDLFEGNGELYLLPIIITENLPNVILENCIGGQFSFGSDVDFGSNNLTDSSTYINCKAATYSFASNAEASGTYINCSVIEEYLVPNSFSGAFGAFGVASGYFYNCSGGSNSFASGGIASGYFQNCNAYIGAFGDYGTCSGTLVNCTGYEYCFGDTGVLSGKLFYCRLTTPTSGIFPTVSGGGRTYYCIDGNGNTNNQ